MKISILGKQIPAFVIAMLVIAGLGSAALVGYISNTVTVDIEVSSPIVAGVSLGRDSWSATQCLNTDSNDPNYGQTVDSFPECDDPTMSDWAESDWGDSILISDIHGGETVTLYTKSQNIANVEITGFEEAIVGNPSGVTCGDFESVKVRVDSIFGGLGYGEEHDLIALGGCHFIDNYHIKFGTLDDSTWGVGETDVTMIVVTFKTGALGTYTLTYRVVPAY